MKDPVSKPAACRNIAQRALRAARLALPLLAMAALPPDAAWAVQRGRTLQERAFASGGVSDGERQELQARREAYSLWVITAALRSGAYLSDARVSIRDAIRQVVFDGPLDGPWLFIDLALGSYEVEVTWQGQTARRTTTIHAGDHHQILVYFDLVDEVGLPPQRVEPAASTTGGGR